MLTNSVRCANIFERYPGVAQVVARLTGGQEAAGSSPVTRTIKNRATEVALFFYFRSWMNLRPLACHPRAVAA